MAPNPTPRPRPSRGSQGASRARPAGVGPGGDRGPGGPRGPRPGRPTGPRRPAAISPGRRRGFGGGARPYDYAAYEREPATPEYMARLFALHDTRPTPRQQEQFWRFYELLRLHNARLDLTRIMGLEATVEKHFVDSLWPERLLPPGLAPRGPVLDIGTGPGFPGVPLAILRPGRAVILAESRGKRVGFLDLLRRELGLGNARVHPHSVREDSPFAAAPADGPEDWAPEGGTDAPEATAAAPWPVRDVATRALEAIAVTLARIGPFLPQGGRAYFWKGPDCGQEVSAAQQAMRPAFRMAADLRYDLPGTRQRRRLVVFEKR